MELIEGQVRVLVVAQSVRLGEGRRVGPVVVVVDVVVVVCRGKRGVSECASSLSAYSSPPSLEFSPEHPLLSISLPSKHTSKDVEAVVPLVALPNVDLVGL